MKIFRRIREFFYSTIAPVPLSEKEIDVVMNETFDTFNQEMELEEAEQQGDQVSSIVSVIIMESGNIDIQMQWGDPTDASAHNFATMLHQLNTGSYEEACAGVLIGMGQQNPQVMPYVRSVITDWNKLKAQQPIIKPSEVFHMNHNNKGE